MNKEQKLLNRIAELEAQLAVVQQGVPAARSGRKVLVDSGALQMALNALERDALEGKLVRAEMRVELMQSITHPAQQGLDAIAALEALVRDADSEPDGDYLDCAGKNRVAVHRKGIERARAIAAKAKQGE